MARAAGELTETRSGCQDDTIESDGDLGAERDWLGSRSRAKQQPPLFSTIQVGPKDRLRIPPAGWKCGKRTAAVAVRLLL